MKHKLKNYRNHLLFKALKLRRGLISFYRAEYGRARRGSADPFGELFVTEFFSVEKQIIAAVKDFDSASSFLLPCEENDSRPRAEAAAQKLAELEMREDEIINALEGTELTERELSALPKLLRLELLERLFLLTKSRTRGSAETELSRLLSRLRACGELDWDEITRAVSPVERVLRNSEGFDLLDKSSRELCVRSVERLARELKISETEGARKTVELADGEKGRRAHAAYFLLAEGEKELRRALRPTRPRLGLAPVPAFILFISGFVTLTLALSAAFLPRGWLAFISTLFPSACVSLSIMTTVFGLSFRPRGIVRFDIEKIDAGRRTAVAVPVLLTDESSAREATERLEAHYLANRVEGVKFILLADLPDADSAQKEGDAEIIRAAKDGIIRLNAVYGERFYLLLRARKPNADGVFQGHERKRGAVTELARLLAGGGNGFAEAVPNAEIRADFLAVLDADTVLPSGTLGKLIGTAAHPVNSPVIENGRVTEGYSVFVPRMRTTARSAAKSFFSRLFSGDVGYELYSQAVSNLHMDAYREGDFGGKGMLNVGAFLKLTEGRIPDNAVLSHDLLEGSFARAAYLNDVVLLDSEPPTLPKWWKRQERWLRGDWQLIPFILGRRGRGLSTINRAKMLGNLFRSLREPVTLLLLALSVATGSAALAVFTLTAFLFEPIKGFLLLAASSLKERAAQDRWFMLVLRSFTELAALPFAALTAVSAILTALWRTLVSHRNMLLWQTAASSKADEGRLTVINAAVSAIFSLTVTVMSASGGLNPAGIISLALG